MGRDGQQRQVKVDTVVSCFIRIKLQNWHSCVEMAVGCGFTACKYLIVRTICLNKALFYVLLTCLFIVMVTFIYILLICSCFLLLSVNKI